MADKTEAIWSAIAEEWRVYMMMLAREREVPFARLYSPSIDQATFACPYCAELLNPAAQGCQACRNQILAEERRAIQEWAFEMAHLGWLYRCRLEAETGPLPGEEGVPHPFVPPPSPELIALATVLLHGILQGASFEAVKNLCLTTWRQFSRENAGGGDERSPSRMIPSGVNEDIEVFVSRFVDLCYDFWMARSGSTHRGSKHFAAAVSKALFVLDREMANAGDFSDPARIKGPAGVFARHLKRKRDVLGGLAEKVQRKRRRRKA